jgi:head-tail adaptor
MNINELDTKMHLFSISAGLDSAGGPTETPVFVADLWGSYDDNPNEAANTYMVNPNNAVVINTHRRADITNHHILHIDGQLYNVRGIKKLDRLFMQITADEYEGSTEIIDAINTLSVKEIL